MAQDCCILDWLQQSRPNNIEGWLDVRPSTKSFPDSNEIWCVGRGQWVMPRRCTWVQISWPNPTQAEWISADVQLFHHFNTVSSVRSIYIVQYSNPTHIVLYVGLQPSSHAPSEKLDRLYFVCWQSGPDICDGMSNGGEVSLGLRRAGRYCQNTTGHLRENWVAGRLLFPETQ